MLFTVLILENVPRRPRRGRAAFTLVELIVVVTIILVLAGLAVAFIPNLGDRQREADGAAMLQGWLNIARTRALRDQAPRGLRLFPYNNQPPNTLLPTNPAQLPNIVIEAQYVDQPDDLFGATLGCTLTAPAGVTSPPWNTVAPVWTTVPAGNTVMLQGADLFNGFSGPTPAAPLNNQFQVFWSVQAGDYLEIQGLMHQITGILQMPPPLNPPNTFVVSLASPVSFALGSTSYFHIIRQPRVSGEERLSFPANIGIDLNTNAAVAAGGYSNSGANPALQIPSNLVANVNPATGLAESYDILFTPAGNVIGSQVGSGANQAILWVRDYTLPPPYQSPYQQQGEPTLVLVNIQSGLVAAVPVDQSNGFQPSVATPYTFTANP